MTDADRLVADAEFRGEMREFMRDQRQDTTDIKKSLEKQNGRIGALERFRAWTMGVGAALGSAFGALGAFLWERTK